MEFSLTRAQVENPACDKKKQKDEARTAHDGKVKIKTTTGYHTVNSEVLH